MPQMNLLACRCADSPASDYEDMPQLENGVGMLALFREEIETILETDNMCDCPRRDLFMVPGATIYVNFIF